MADPKPTHWEIRIPLGRESDLDRVPCGDLGIAGVMLHWGLGLSFFRFDGPRSEGETHFFFAVTTDGKKRAEALKLGYEVRPRRAPRKPGGLSPEDVRWLVRLALEGFEQEGPAWANEPLFNGYDRPRFETQGALAEALGVSADTLTRWKRKGAPEKDKAKIAKLFTPRALLLMGEPPLPKTLESKTENAGSPDGQETLENERSSGPPET